MTVPKLLTDPRESNALRQGAIASGPSSLAPGLYLVATPIGNLRDITLRALDVLASADLVLAEDTRMSRRLFDAHGLHPKCSAYHEHNADKRLEGVIRSLEDGARIALISDAGTPLISDPGYKLVREAAKREIAVFAIPGPSATLAALTVSGLPTNTFFFAGFLPPRSAARKQAIAALKAVPASLVFYESPARIMATLADMNAVLGPRNAALARELTKRYETVYRAPLDQLGSLIPKEELRGEMVLIVAPPDADTRWDDAQVDQALDEAMARTSLKSAVDEITQLCGHPRRDVYRQALTLKNKS